MTDHSASLELLNALNEHRGRTRLPHLAIEHCVVQVAFRPFQPEILPDERSSRFVRCVNQLDRPVLTFAPGDQSADLMIARCIEKYLEDILAAAEKKLRAAADNHRRTAGKCRFDSYF